MNIRKHACLLFAAAATFALPLCAHAHHAMGGALPRSAFEGLISGLAHPIVGLDHFLFVLAIGAACYHFGVRAGMAAAFVAGTLAGTAVHLYEATLAYPDAWVAVTLIVLGGLFLAGRGPSKAYAAALFFAACGVLHGYAYGESIVGAEPAPLAAYLAGFALVQLAVVFGAYAAARALHRVRPGFPTARAVGGVLSVAGAVFLALAFA